MQTALCILVLLSCNEGVAAPPARPQWSFSFATRAWYSDAGLRPSARQVVEEGHSIAPQVELEAQREHLLIRFMHQFATPYDATRKFVDGFTDGGLKREDSEYAAGWRFSLFEQQYFLRPIIGYKQLTVIQENLRSEIPDDYNYRYRGPFLAASNKLVLWDSFSIDLLALVAKFSVHADQVLSEVPYQPFRYDATGILIDLSLNATLGSARFMLGYKLQNYPSRQERITIPLRDAQGEVILDPSGNPLFTQVGAPDFDAHGLIFGVSYQFNL